MKTKINQYLEYERKINDNKGTNSYDNIMANYANMFFDKYDCLSDTKKLVVFYKDNTKLSNKSINKIIKFLRLVYKHHNINDSNLFNFKLLKEKYVSRQTISKENLKRIFNYVENMQDKGNAETYQMMTYLLYDTGVRPNELLNIKTKNIDITNRSIYLETTKTGVPRTVFMSKIIVARLNRYLKKHDHEYLFWNKLRNRLTNRNDLKSFWRRVKKGTDIDVLNSYMFRHTYITDLVDLDIPMVVVQNQVGHTNIKTTMIYYHTNTAKQKRHLMDLNRII